MRLIIFTSFYSNRNLIFTLFLTDDITALITALSCPCLCLDHLPRIIRFALPQMASKNRVCHVHRSSFRNMI